MTLNVTSKAFTGAFEFAMIIICSLTLARFSYRPVSKFGISARKKSEKS